MAAKFEILSLYRTTQEPKGITYIKYSKTSEAALAMEEMNGRCIASCPRPLKVLIGNNFKNFVKSQLFHYP